MLGYGSFFHGFLEKALFHISKISRNSFFKKVLAHELFTLPSGQFQQMIIAKKHFSVIVQLEGDKVHGLKCFSKPPVTFNQKILCLFSLYRLAYLMRKFCKL
ncbi:MAG: hypothetical protein BWY05_01012 [Euryarchaeota archaeon ADurb.Bin165]|nr:MAG: hypothetical protein BWY05_01012 [Euryarchaeota archaeon ADurb.Bin165]